MSAEVKKEIQIEIAHVLFIDIVGYSKLLINEQHELLQELNQIVRTTEAFRVAEAAGKLIRLPTGDGMALAFATTPEAPVQCALEISKALKSHPELRVRMGIHSGPVSGLSDVNDRSNIAGAGINMAQRVMDCGDGGHILLSRRVAVATVPARSRRMRSQTRRPRFRCQSLHRGTREPGAARKVQDSPANRVAGACAPRTFTHCSRNFFLIAYCTGNSPADLRASIVEIVVATSHACELKQSSCGRHDCGEKHCGAAL